MIPGKTPSAAAKSRCFHPGQIWRDDNGKPIQAHGGGVIHHEGTYYWYGENKDGATITGNGPEALSMIDMVGSDLGFGLGTCGKEGQGVPVGDAQPTLRFGPPYLTVG